MLEPTAIVVAAWLAGWMIDALLLNAGDTIGSLYLVAKAPGTVLHEASHVLACLLFGVQVRKVTFFQRQRGEPNGFVEHAGSTGAFAGLAIGISPLVLLPCVAAGLAELAMALDATVPGSAGAGLAWFLTTCMAMSSRPSSMDWHVAWDALAANRREAIAAAGGMAAGLVASVLLPLSWATWWHLAIHVLVVLVPGWLAARLATRGRGWGA